MRVFVSPGIGVAGIPLAMASGPLASDSFNRADAATLGTNWTNNRNSAGIFTNAVDVDAGGNTCISWYNGVAWPNDHFSQVTSLLNPAAGQACAAAARLPTTPANDLDGYYGGYDQAQFGDGNRRIFKWVGGTLTSLATEAIACVAGDVFKLIPVGTTLTFYVNGVLRLTANAVTDFASGNAGIYLRHPAIDVGVLDDWSGGTP